MTTAEHIEGRAPGSGGEAPAAPGRPRRLVVLAWIALVAVAALDAGAIWAATGFERDLAPSAVLVVGVTLAASVTGLLIVRRHPANAIGWLLTAHGLLVCLVLTSDTYAYWGGVLHPRRVPLAGWVGLWSDISWPLLYIGLVLIALVFPDGRFLSAWWRRFALAACLAVALFMLASAFDVDRFDGRLAPLPPPLPKLPDPLVFPLEMVGLAGIAAGLVGATIAARRRFRRSMGIARVQMLWFAYAALAIPAGLATCLVDQLVTGGIGGITLVGVCVSGTLIPLAIGAAILRHRLFDIELVLSRTLVYGFLTVVVVVVYAAAILGVGSLVDDRGVAGLVAVAVVSVVIHPLHARVRRAVERWVYGDRSDPYAALSRLSDRLQDSMAPDQVVQTIVDSVAEALRLPRVAIELDAAAGAVVAASRGEAGRGAPTRTPLLYQGESLGWLVAEAPPGRDLAPADRRLLADLARHAGVAVHAVGLTLGLQRSRERLVSAREEERRRLRRDLHDGIGPTLAAIVLKLDAAEAAVSDERAAALLAELRAETREAIADIRRLVHELRPPALDDFGLLGAIGRQAERLSHAGAGVGGGLIVVVDGPPEMPLLPAATEVAAYRIALEAMTNVVRHAGARRCVVTVAVNGGLELTIADNGVGLAADAASGIGRASMRERAEELGGSCEVAPRPGGGTLVRALLPIPPP